MIADTPGDTLSNLAGQRTHQCVHAVRHATKDSDIQHEAGQSPKHTLKWIDQRRESIEDSREHPNSGTNPPWPISVTGKTADPQSRSPRSTPSSSVQPQGLCGDVSGHNRAPTRCRPTGAAGAPAFGHALAAGPNRLEPTAISVLPLPKHPPLALPLRHYGSPHLAGFSARGERPRLYL